jgi:hypothetical protein
MNKQDFEKTQIWAAKAEQAQATPTSDFVTESFFPSPETEVKKTTVKKLSKEEIALLAGGGVLVVGLGVIVVTNFSTDIKEDAILAPPTIEGKLPIIEEIKPTFIVDKPDLPKISHTPPKHENHHKVENHAVVQHDEKIGSLIHTPHELLVATSPSDTQSFETAAQMARSEVGPGGIFAWRGTFYSTFTETEWERLPESERNNWVSAAEPIIEPHAVHQDAVIQPDDILSNSMVVAERGAITWTGIDKDGDGKAEILLARVHGQSPVVMMDTDGDGKLDSRFQLDVESGKTVMIPIEHLEMGLHEVKSIPTVDAGSNFYTIPANTIPNSTELPVSIYENEGQYFVGVDANHDGIVDVFTIDREGSTPLVGMDMDNDGKVETSFIYNATTHEVNEWELVPIQEITIDSIENDPDDGSNRVSMLDNSEPQNHEGHLHDETKHHSEVSTEDNNLDEHQPSEEHQEYAYSSDESHDLDDFS